MTEFNIQSLPFGGGVKITDTDFNVVRQDNLINCLIINYNNTNFIKTCPSDKLLHTISSGLANINNQIYEDVDFIANVFINNIFFIKDNNMDFDAFSIIVEFHTINEGYILTIFEL